MRSLLLLVFLIANSSIFSQLQIIIKERPVKEDSVIKDAEFKEILLKTLKSYNDSFTTLQKSPNSKPLTDSSYNVLLKLPGAKEASVMRSKDFTALVELFYFKNYDEGLRNLLMKIKYSLPDDFVYNEEEDLDNHIHYYTFFQAPDSKNTHHGFPDKFVIKADVVATTFSIMRYGD